MPDMSSPPKPLPAGLRWYVALSKWMLGLALCFWALLLLASLALHFLIVPRIIDWRTEIEDAASKAWGVKVSMGQLTTVSDGLVPSVEVRDFVLRNAQDQEVLRLPKLRASLSPASLLSLKLEHIELDGPELEVRHHVDGSWQVAGLALGASDSSAFADWLLRQPEFQIHQGRLRWVDDFNQQPAVAFSQVSLLMYNGLRSHEWRLDATPPPDWGQRVSLQGQFKQALLNRHASDISTWQGRLYAEMPQVDLSKLSVYSQALSGLAMTQGQGWLRAWADWDRGEWRQPIVDLGLQQLKVQWSPTVAPLELQALSGRLHFNVWTEGSGHELRTQDVQLTLDDGQTWRSARSRLAWQQDGSNLAPKGELQIDHINLAVLGRLGKLLPLPDDWQQHLDQAKPEGRLTQLDWRWFDLNTPAVQFNVKGQLDGFSLQSSAPNSPAQALWWPGVQDAQLQFEFSELGGKAQVAINNGSLSLVDWLAEARIPLQQAEAELAWELKDQRWVLQLNKGQLKNDLAQGDVNLTWRQGEPKKPLGDLDLKVDIQRLDARALHRYLPQAMDASVRQYLREAIGAGVFTQAKLALQGPLDLFPFVKSSDGIFTINAPFQQAQFQYVPPTPLNLSSKPTPSWPGLQQLSGELQINRNRLQVKSGSARMGPAGMLQIPRLEVQINDMNDPVVDINAVVKSQLMDALQMVRSTPLADPLGNTLDGVQATGLAEQQLRITVPLSKPSLARLQANLKFDGNDVQWAPHLPRLSKLRGNLTYSESGVVANGVRLRVLGSDAKLDGGLRFNDSLTDGPTRLVLQGGVNAEALQQTPELGSLASVAGLLRGSTSYVASLGLRQGQVEYALSSNLQGMSLELPEPLNKPVAAAWPLRVESQVLRLAGKSAPLEQLSFTLGSVLSVKYVRDVSAASTQLLGGLLQLGTVVESKDNPDKMVLAQIRHPKFNVDEWQQAVSPWTDAEPEKGGAPRQGLAMHMPSRIELNTPELTYLGRNFKQVQAVADKQAKLWRIQAKATELQGTAEFRPAQDNTSARVVARLNYLVVPPSVLEEVETLMAESPKDMPALDIVVDNLEVRGISLGRAEIDGFARTNLTGAREWVLNKFNLSTPEAKFQSKGQWGGPGKAAAKRSQLDFTLDIQDSGELLERFGHKGAIRQGKGRMAGQVGWQGSPFSTDYTTMAGQFTVNIERGQFLKADPGVTRLLGVLSLQSLPRRLTLDFKDLFSEGFAFDFVRGDVVIAQGIASTNNLQMKGVSAAVLMEGRADIQRETQDIKVVVVPELNAGTASLVYSAINPLVGLTSFLAQYVLRRPLMKSNTQEFRVEGSWKEPKVSKVESAPAKKEAEPQP